MTQRSLVSELRVQANKHLTSSQPHVSSAVSASPGNVKIAYFHILVKNCITTIDCKKILFLLLFTVQYEMSIYTDIYSNVRIESFEVINYDESNLLEIHQTIIKLFFLLTVIPTILLTRSNSLWTTLLLCKPLRTFLHASTALWTYM